MSILPVELNIDLDSLFKLNFNYNFEILKQTIDGLIKNQVGLHKNIAELHIQNKDKDNLIQSLIKELKGSGLIKEFDETQYQNSSPDIGIVVTLGNCDNNNNNNNINLSQLNNNNGNLSKSILNEINDKLSTLTQKKDAHEKRIGEINDKINDISILDLFKNDAPGDDQNSNKILNLINNLDTKIRQKFKLNEERFSKNEEDIFKLKSDVNNIKNSQDSYSRSLKNNKESLEDLSTQIATLKSSIDTLNNKTEEDTQKQIDLLKSLLDNKLKEIEDKRDDKILNRQLSTPPENNQEKEDKSSVSNRVNQDIPSVAMEEISKQIKEMRKQMGKFSSQTSPEGLSKEIHAIKEELNQKCPVNQHKELANIVDELSKRVSVTRDQLSTHIEDSSGHESIRIIQKKNDLVMGMILQFQSSLDDKSKNAVNPIHNEIKDYSKFLEIEAFNGFKGALNEKLAYLSDNIGETRQLIEELFILIKQKAGQRDLKELEEVILDKFEELRMACQKRFADKVEMGKNLKFLDTQIKNVLEINIRRNDKGDNWLLTKKPLGGHLCASCENYIGDLKESNTYVPWNKYPIKDQNDKLYRLGNGFSKMLQMVGNEAQGDKKDMKDAFSTSQECFSSANHRKENEKTKDKQEKNKEALTPKRDQSLPRLRKNESVSLFPENENAQDNLNLTQDEENQTKPKM